ncbi:hypothetical protein DPEC_G00303320 [Dallia pectoralis]|uniref:Uncharacterized protein n=1 Tax=Dallia pectoralis TaxID=75939 RepID=A0ACC2FD79_DALPE|nr:hypothetical protein DPEC_G00303320 [Dallia pectoralis]
MEDGRSSTHALIWQQGGGSIEGDTARVLVCCWDITVYWSLIILGFFTPNKHIVITKKTRNREDLFGTDPRGKFGSEEGRKLCKYPQIRGPNQ